MARIHRIAKSRKEQRCMNGGHVIEVGSSYLWMNPRYRGKMVTCPVHPFKGSQMTGGKLSGVYAANEDLEETMSHFGEPMEAGDLDSLAEAVQSAADEVRTVAEEYEESATNIEDGFGHETFMSSELREKAEEVEGYASELEESGQGLESAATELREAEEALEEANNAEVDEEAVKEAVVEASDKEGWALNDEVTAKLDEAKEELKDAVKEAEDELETAQENAVTAKDEVEGALSGCSL
jgi:chromosome segregation ATPase